MKIRKIEKLLACEGDALLESKRERVLAECGVVSRMTVTRPVFERPHLRRMAAAMLAVILAISIAIPFVLKNNEKATLYCRLDDISAAKVTGSYMRRAFICFPAEKTYTLSVDDSLAADMFGAEEMPMGLAEGSKVYYYGSGEIFEVVLKFSAECGEVHMNINPEVAPDFLLYAGDEEHTLLGDDNAVVINRYKVGMKETYYNDQLDSIDIGLEKDGMGIWLWSDAENKAELEQIFNLILNSDIDLTYIEKLIKG